MKFSKLQVFAVSLLLSLSLLILLVAIFARERSVKMNTCDLNVDGIEITKEEYVNGNLVSATYVLSLEDAKKISEAINFEVIDFSDDVLKIEFEKMYILKINEYQFLYIDRSIDTSAEKTYMMYLTKSDDATNLLGAYVDTKIIKVIDDIIVNANRK